MYRASQDPKNAEAVARIIARHESEAIVIIEMNEVPAR